MESDRQVRILDALIRYYLRVPDSTPLSESTPISTLAGADWRVVDLAIAVESELGIALSADRALALSTVGDWHDLLRHRDPTDKGYRQG